jgi:glycosyltransferase involved in cell wall biosynthesis
VKLLLCGSGEDEDLLRAHVREHQLQDHVEFLGWMSQAELINAFLGAHVFLHPSEQTASGDREGVPNSMLEAMASGLPVVATHHGGIPEAVTCGRDGTLVPERRPDLLAEALIALMSSPETLLRMSACAAVSVREAFGIDQRIAALEDCYTEAAELGRARARPRWAGW